MSVLKKNADSTINKNKTEYNYESDTDPNILEKNKKKESEKESEAELYVDSNSDDSDEYEKECEYETNNIGLCNNCDNIKYLVETKCFICIKVIKKCIGCDSIHCSDCQVKCNICKNCSNKHGKLLSKFIRKECKICSLKYDKCSRCLLNNKSKYKILNDNDICYECKGLCIKHDSIISMMKKKCFKCNINIDKDSIVCESCKFNFKLCDLCNNNKFKYKNHIDCKICKQNLHFCNDCMSREPEICGKCYKLFDDKND